MRYLSLFSGIEACTVAWHQLGWEAVAYAEFDQFPSALLAHTYPDVINLGDVTKITDEVLKELGPIDLVVGGSPCQDLSIAGKRAGMTEGTRSNLFHEQMRIFHAARSICGARFLLWENVPGAFSSNNGSDFATVVGEMAGCELRVPNEGWQNTGVALGKNGLCECSVLDAQWFGVPQRRRRVFALLDTGNWDSRPPILFEPESLQGHPSPRRETKKDVTKGFRMCAFGEYADDETGSALKQRDYKDATDLITIPIHDQATRHAGKRGDLSDGKGNGLGVGKDGDVCPTLTSGDKHAVAFNSRQDPVCTGDVTGALDSCTPQAQAIYDNHASDSRCKEVDVCPTITSKWGTGGGNVPFHRQDMAVRRLTPIECERLQGFPDNYTRIPYRGKPAEKCPDGARYKALGNSMAVPVMKWIGQRVQQHG